MANLLQYLAPLPQNPLQQGSPSLADAWEHNARAVRDYVAQQRAISAQRGLWDDQTGMPTMAGARDAAGQVANGLLMGTTAPGFRAFHGSPHSFDRFSTDKIGTGEGAQAYGHGLYFADREATARTYRDVLGYKHTDGAPAVDWNDPASAAGYWLGFHGGDKNAAIDYFNGLKKSEGQWLNTGRKANAESNIKLADDAIEHLNNGTYNGAPNPGHMYEVQINANPEHFLDWDKPLSEQSKHVQEALAPQLDAIRNRMISDASSWGTPSAKDVSGYTKQADEVVSRMRGEDIVRHVSRWASDNPTAFPGMRGYTQNLSSLTSDVMREAGIPGIRYLDGGSRGAGEGTSNHVIFDPATIEILRKYGIAGLMGGGAAAATQATEQ